MMNKFKKVNNIKTTDTSDLVKNTDYNTKINEIEKKIIDHDHGEYITAQELKKLTVDNFAARLKQANLASKNYIADILFRKKKRYFDEKLKNYNKQITSNKTKHILIQSELKVEQDKTKKIQTFDLSLLIG